MTPVGFSHSEISGSRPVCDSPELFAANYVLHRHLTPRHSSCALSSLTANLLECGTLRGFRASRDELRLAEPGCVHAFCEPWDASTEVEPQDFTESWVVFATINYRDTPSRIVASYEVPIPAPSSTSYAGLADAVQGRDRSSSSELQSLDSIRRSFSFSRHAFASSSILQFSESFRVFSTTDSISSVWKQTSQRSRRKEITRSSIGGA